MIKPHINQVREWKIVEATTAWSTFSSLLQNDSDIDKVSHKSLYSFEPTCNDEEKEANQFHV